MDSLSSVSPSIVLPNSNLLHHHRRRISFTSPFLRPVSQFRVSYSVEICRRRRRCRNRRICNSARLNSSDEEEEEEEEGGIKRDDEEVEKALRMDGTIPGSSKEFVERVSSRAYDMRRHLQQSFDTSSYDVLEANPWRSETEKPLYVLTHSENQLCTMKIRRDRSEVEGELDQLFSSKGEKRKSQGKQSGNDTKFEMLVEDIREGVLVFEDENEAAKYCDLLQGGGQDCEGVAEVEASMVFDLCRMTRALAVLFRRGRTPPLPESLKLYLRARKRSLED
ncbi:hypothetical protein M9H77_09929 [Catharanthus roseus]|uniref:Uncharacterized protein n=1 Tax=Catharanthus roseus TaxID=4058 RepID=A0ACC0C208_CATRO|nr:hypothetical protein M9H77_09929 [Catharanthus roseus]